MERVLCLAYYFTREMGHTGFSSRDISMLNTEAAQSKISAEDVLSDAYCCDYIAGNDGGNQRLRIEGERLVEALPDFDLADEYAVYKKSAGKTPMPGKRH